MYFLWRKMGVALIESSSSLRGGNKMNSQRTYLGKSFRALALGETKNSASFRDDKVESTLGGNVSGIPSPSLLSSRLVEETRLPNKYTSTSSPFVQCLRKMCINILRTGLHPERARAPIYCRDAESA